MRCPIRPDHDLVEIAPEVFQCPRCGFGPSQGGNRGYWALSYLEFDGSRWDGLCITWDRPQYVMSSVCWEVDTRGERIPGSMHEDFTGYVDPAELGEVPLPALPKNPDERWKYPPERSVLTPGMFDNPLGEKLVVLSQPRRGKSGSKRARR